MINTNTKRCGKCREIKVFSEFYNDKKTNTGFKCYCKACVREYNMNRARTKEGVVTKIYAAQRASSRVRDHLMPSYSLAELKKWALAKSVFHELYIAWVKSDYKKEAVPSFDRLNDYKPYSLDNLRITTWQENNSKGSADRANGINNKHSTAIVQMDLEGGLIAEHCSMRYAERAIGVSNADISACCSGKRKSAGGFRWIRSLGIPIHNNVPCLGAGII